MAPTSSLDAHEGMTRFLCSFFDKTLKEFQYTLKEKTYLEKFFGVSSPDVTQGVTTSIAATLYSGIILANSR